MKTRFASIVLPLAGACALVLAGCGTMDRSDRMAQTSGYVGDPYSSPSTPAQMDPFSRAYIPFPASANESPGIIGHSPYCLEHYNQPGCQTVDSMRGARFSRNDRGYYRDGWRGPVNPNPDTQPENAQGVNSPRR